MRNGGVEMKIALIATEKLPVPAIKGGAIQIYLDSVAAIMSELHSVTIISISDPNLPDNEVRNNVQYVRFPVHDYLLSISNYLKESPFDIVHVCNRPLWINVLKEVIPQTTFILSVHNEMFASEKITDEEGSTCITNVSGIVTVSDYIGKTITDRFQEALPKTKTVYSGVDLLAFHPIWTEKGQLSRDQARKALSLEGKKIILFVGRLSKVKGIHILLLALPSIIKKHPDAVMVFVGSKWFGDDSINHYVKHIYTLSSLYKEHVVFTKFIPPKHIPHLFSMSDVFVCSSQWQEPLARVHYEAMAAGLPIITSNRGGNPEVIDEGHNGFVISEYDNPKEYASKIIELLNDSEKREILGRNGRTKVENSYSWKHVSSNLIKVYEEAFKKGKDE